MWATISGDWWTGGLCTLRLELSSMSGAWTGPAVVALAIVLVFVVTRRRSDPARVLSGERSAS